MRGLQKAPKCVQSSDKHRRKFILIKPLVLHPQKEKRKSEAKCGEVLHKVLLSLQFWKHRNAGEFGTLMQLAPVTHAYIFKTWLWLLFNYKDDRKMNF